MDYLLYKNKAGFLKSVDIYHPEEATEFFNLYLPVNPILEDYFIVAVYINNVRNKFNFARGTAGSSDDIENAYDSSRNVQTAIANDFNVSNPDLQNFQIYYLAQSEPLSILILPTFSDFENSLLSSLTGQLGNIMSLLTDIKNNGK